MSPERNWKKRIEDILTCISRRHAQIEQEGDRFFLVDLDSVNGTKLNGQRILPREKKAGLGWRCDRVWTRWCADGFSGRG